MHTPKRPRDRPSIELALAPQTYPTAMHPTSLLHRPAHAPDLAHERFRSLRSIARRLAHRERLGRLRLLDLACFGVHLPHFDAILRGEGQRHPPDATADLEAISGSLASETHTHTHALQERPPLCTNLQPSCATNASLNHCTTRGFPPQAEAFWATWAMNI